MTPAAAAVIGAMTTVAARLPVTAELRPYVNPRASDLAYDAVVLTDLFADRPGEGAGTAYMAELVRLCDAAGVTLYTDAACPRSTAFYLSRGLSRTEGRRDHQLVRHPPEDPGED